MFKYLILKKIKLQERGYNFIIMYLIFINLIIEVVDEIINRINFILMKCFIFIVNMKYII